MIVNSIISWGYVDLLETFFKANNLEVKCTERGNKGVTTTLVTLEYEDNSDTAYSITLMSIRHLGFENMLCDYLRRCGVSLNMISIGRTAIRRDMRQLDKDWEEYKKHIGI